MKSQQEIPGTDRVSPAGNTRYRPCFASRVEYRDGQVRDYDRMPGKILIFAAILRHT